MLVLISAMFLASVPFTALKLHLFLDATLSKRFRITERSAVSFRLEGYNLFNNVNFGTPGLTMATPTALGKFSAIIGSPRIVRGSPVLI